MRTGKDANRDTDSTKLLPAERKARACPRFPEGFATSEEWVSLLLLCCCSVAPEPWPLALTTPPSPLREHLVEGSHAEKALAVDIEFLGCGRGEPLAGLDR